MEQPAVNVVIGGPGDDDLSVVDGTARVDCGSGLDWYRADPSDTRAGCEVRSDRDGDSRRCAHRFGSTSS